MCCSSRTAGCIMSITSSASVDSRFLRRRERRSAGIFRRPLRPHRNGQTAICPSVTSRCSSTTRRSARWRTSVASGDLRVGRCGHYGGTQRRSRCPADTRRRSYSPAARSRRRPSICPACRINTFKNWRWPFRLTELPSRLPGAGLGMAAVAIAVLSGASGRSTGSLRGPVAPPRREPWRVNPRTGLSCPRNRDDAAGPIRSTHWPVSRGRLGLHGTVVQAPIGRAEDHRAGSRWLDE